LSLPYLSATGQNINGISSLLQSFERDLDFNGVVLITKSDEVLLQQGYGYLDKKKTIKTDKNAIYNIASITKSFTGIAILKLVEQGKLKLSDTVGTFFQNVPKLKSGISIHQLLIHQSGLQQTYAADGERNVAGALEKIWRIKTDVRPGEKFIYSNDNYTLLGIIIEKVTGKRWKDYVRETVLKPLDMTNTFFWGEENQTGLPMVVPKEKKKQQADDYGFIGATGIFSNVTDLLKFQHALKGNLILNDSSKALLIGNYVKLTSALPNSTDYYNYGLFRTTGERESIWARGNEEGWGTSIAYLFPDKDISVIVLSSSEQLKNGERAHIYVSSQIIKQL
jgi:CubicO group peptidase (beta-lactamase class C family)